MKETNVHNNFKRSVVNDMFEKPPANITLPQFSRNIGGEYIQGTYSKEIGRSKVLKGKLIFVFLFQLFYSIVNVSRGFADI